MNFTAIDFETATSKYTSICSMGICVVENNVITERKEIFIRPEPLEFHEYNIKIHGITPNAVKDKPQFNEYWEQIRPYLENRLVVAHNTSFDITALCATLDFYNIPYPKFQYMCTVKLSQKAYPELKSHKLNNLCDALGITFSHHHAYDDAYACAMVLLRILYDYSLLNANELAECFDVKIGKLYPGCKVSTHQREPKQKKNAQPRRFHNSNTHGSL
ncbi:MAG: 3'-5' exonuclease [Clostridiales bacterium]|nr:3'-5' exonuclease [Clostridiales bacterium]